MKNKLGLTMAEPLDPEIEKASAKLLLEAGYHVEGYPVPGPKTLWGYLFCWHTKFIRIIVALAIGMISNLILLFSLMFVFAEQPSVWVNFYFGNDGLFFLGGTALIAIVVFPRLRKLKLI